MLAVDLKGKKCSIKVKNGATIIEGEWQSDIMVDDTIWCFESVKGERVL